MYIPVDHPERICDWCGNWFKPTTKHKKFCDKNCYRSFGKNVLGHSKGAKRNRKEKILLINYRKYKLSICSLCGFIPKHPCQLDVDHIDGDHSNNAIENLQTICANCHRYKTGIQLGWFK